MIPVMPGMLGAVGGTPLVELARIRRARGARVMLKLEFANPTGSMKDRLALAMIQRAAADGRLRPGGRVVEYTGGSTGTALAFDCAAAGYRSTRVSSDAFSEEKRSAMAAFGAEVVLCREWPVRPTGRSGARRITGALRGSRWRAPHRGDRRRVCPTTVATRAG